MNKLFPLSVLAFVCTSSSFVLADDKLEEIVVTSSRVPMPLREVGTSVSVISADEIRQRGFNSLYEILRSQPGVAASNNGGHGKVTSLRIRGEEGYRTLMLLDGMDISDTSSPQVGPHVEHLLSSGIERVEILRGPQGLMYGADAGGVINISSGSPEEGIAGGVSAEGGRYATRQLGANLSGKNDTVDFSVSAVDFETDGFNALTEDTELVDDDGFENTTLHGRLGWNVTEALRLQLVAHDVDSKNEYDNCGFPTRHDCFNDFEQSAWLLEANYDTTNFKNQLSYNRSETERKFYTGGELSFSAEGELQRLSYLGSYSPSDSLRLVYGLDHETETIKDGVGDPERDQDGYYAEYQGRFEDRLFITAGLRYDDNDDFGTHTSYRVSGAYLFDLTAGELKLKGSFGTGFRAPSPSEISYNSGPFSYPPASLTTLSEETSEGYDIGLSWSNDAGLYLEAVYFDQNVEDAIFFDLATFSGYLQDSGDTDSSGVELIAEFPLLESLAITANYTYNDTENSSGDTRIRRPVHLANIGMSWQGLNDKLVLGLNLRAAHDSEDIDGSKIDDYEVLDINASLEILRGLEVYGRVENLLDEDYEEVPTYNITGAAAYAGIRYSF